MNIYSETFQHLWLVIVVIGVGFSAIGMGSLVMGFLSKSTTTKRTLEPSPLVLRFFIGQIFLSVIMTLVCLLLDRPYNLLILLPVVVITALVGTRKVHMPSFKDLSKTSPLILILAGILGSILAFLAVTSFHKPSEWDEVAYHYPVVKEIAQGKLQFPLLQSSPYNSFYLPFTYFYGSLPYGSEAFAALVLVFTSHPSSAHLLYLLNFVAFLGFINFFLTKIYQSDSFTNLSINILLTTNHGLFILLSTGLIDINVMIYQFLAIALSLIGKDKKSVYWMNLSLLCMGFALGQKFTTVFLLPIYIPLMAWWFWPVLKTPRSWVASLFFLSFGGFFWYFKNLVLHFNPLYPLYLGHQGLSNEEYSYMVYSLITSIRIAPSLPSFIQVLKTNYAIETSTVLLTVFLYLAVCFRKIKVTQSTLVLLGYALFLYFCNFVIGSQVSRYVLLTPLIIHVVAVLALKQSKWLVLGTLIICLAFIKDTPLQKIVWKARIKELPQALSMGFHEHDALKIGCPGDVHTYYAKNIADSGKILNFWDAYTSTYYADTHIFYNLGLRPNLSNFSVPAEVKYLYIQKALKADILSNQKGHIYMQPSERERIESSLISGKQPIFTKDSCELYQL